MRENTNNIRTSPKLRFPQFTDPWEQRKLGDLVGSVIGGGTPKTSVSEYWGGDIPWIQSSNVHEDEMFDFDVSKKITKLGLDKSATKLVSESSIAVVTHVGVGKLVFVPYSYTTSQDFTSLAELKTDPIFTCYSLYKRLQDDSHIVQGSAIKGITKDDLLTKTIMIPEKEEQCKIGEYFRSLDNLITLHKRKCEELKEYKKGMLQKMFSKEGETEPEIRFDGFTAPWEQRKFGELCSIVTKQTGFDYTATIKNSLLTEASEDTLPYLQTKNFTGVSIDYNTDYYIPKSVAKEFPKINLDEKCLLFSIVGASVGNIGFFPGDKHCFLSGAICVSKLLNQDDADFLYHYMCSECGQSQIRTCTKGGAQATITIENIRDFTVLLPSEEERKRIGEFLTNLDKTITLHQRKCDALKEYKKGLLQQMIV